MQVSCTGQIQCAVLRQSPWQGNESAPDPGKCPHVEACPFLHGEEAARLAASLKGARVLSPASRSSTQLFSNPALSCHGFMNSTLHSFVSFTVLLTEPTSSFKLLTVEVHLLGESVEYRILKEGGRVSKNAASYEPPFTASDLWAERTQEQWRVFSSEFLFWL